MNLPDVVEYSIIKYHNFNLTVGAIGIIILTFLALKLFLTFFLSFLRRYFKRKNMEEGRIIGFYQIIKYAVWVGFFLSCIKIVGLDITWLIASSAALMVGIGLGLQSVFNNFISGVILLFEGTVDPGDIITVGDMIGIVKKVGLRTSQIRTRNNITIIVPNSKLTDDNVTNWSHMKDPPRFHVSVGVAYGSDTKLVKSLL